MGRLWLCFWRVAVAAWVVSGTLTAYIAVNVPLTMMTRSQFARTFADGSAS